MYSRNRLPRLEIEKTDWEEEDDDYEYENDDGNGESYEYDSEESVRLILNNILGCVERNNITDIVF